MGGVEKKTFRRQVLKYKRLLGEDSFRVRNHKVLDLTLSLLNELHFDNIHIFLPIKRNREVDTFPLIERLFPEKKIMISSTDFMKRQMEFYYWDPKIKLKSNHLDIPEPVNGKPADISKVEVLLVPMVALDKNGNRLGYGGGFYDRLMKNLDPKIKKIGLNIGCTFDRFDFVEPHDVKLDYCITPFETLKFND